jgi:hypothetical protein
MRPRRIAGEGQIGQTEERYPGRVEMSFASAFAAEGVAVLMWKLGRQVLEWIWTWTSMLTRRDATSSGWRRTGTWRTGRAVGNVRFGKT